MGLKHSRAFDIIAIVRERRDLSQGRIYIMLLKGWKGRQHLFWNEIKNAS